MTFSPQLAVPADPMTAYCPSRESETPKKRGTLPAGTRVVVAPVPATRTLGGAPTVCVEKSERYAIPPLVGVKSTASTWLLCESQASGRSGRGSNGVALACHVTIPRRGGAHPAVAGRRG